MNVPALRFPEFEDEWKRKRLEDIASVARGKFSARPRNDPQFFGGETPFVQTGDVVNADRFLKRYSQTLNDTGVAVSRVFPKGSILITIAANIGDVAITSFPIACPDSLVAINAKDDQSTEFLYEYLGTRKNELDSYATQNAQANINLQVLEPLQIPSPSLPEQKKIAAFLGVVDAKIAALRARRDGLERYKRGLMQALFSQTLRFTKPDGSAFPDWEEKRLGELCDALSGYPVDGDEIIEAANDTPLLRGVNITEGVIRHSKEMDRFHGGNIDGLERFLVEEGDVVVGMDGSKVGKNVATISEKDAGSFLIQRVARLRSDGKNDLRLIYQHITSHRFRNYVDIVNTSSGIPHISLKQIRDFQIPTAHPDEQAKIADALSVMDAKITAVGDQVNRMEAFKKGLLQQMFV